MSDLISRSALKKEVESLCMTITGLRAGKGVLKEFMDQYRKTVLRIIDEQPTVEAKPAVHGEWLPYFEEVEIYNAGGFTERKQTGWICSKCGKGHTPVHRSFCSDCGADMRKKVEG